MSNINISGTPLLVIDVQNGFVNENSRYAVPQIKALIEHWRSKGGPIMFTKFINGPGSFWRTLIGWSRLSSSPETDIITELDTAGSKVINKNTYTSFTPEVEELFNLNKWQKVVICGIATDGCVLKTAIDAFEKRIVPIVVSDACASHAGKEINDAGLLLLSRFIGGKQIVLWNDLQKSSE